MRKIKRRILATVCMVIFIAAMAALVISLSNRSEPVLSENVGSGLIQSVSPTGNLSAYPSQKSKIEVVAASGAYVTVRVGSKQYEAEEKKIKMSDFSQYTATVTFPNSEAEINSIGKIVVTAVLGEEIASAEAAEVFYRKKSDKITETTVSQSDGTMLSAENFVPSAGDVSSVSGSTSQKTSAVASQTQQTQTVSNQMCMVSVGAADTWPGTNNDDKFVPFCSTLTNGTVDYIIGTSQAYDSEKKNVRQFYNLASGKRVQTSDVTLLAKTDLGDNKITVQSSQAQNGELIITLSESWKVPYDFSFSPQSYYEANGKLYNVQSFTAETISFTFYHTTEVSGEVKTSGSGVVSSASWSVNSAEKTATLTMPLIAKGKYYGYSAKYDSAGNLVLTVHSKPQSLSGAVILLDPGHGGTDVGALGLSGAVTESAVNLAEAYAVKAELEKRGAVVYLTRTQDTKLSLEDRKKMVYSLMPDVFVSIHSDASDSSDSASGTSSFYFRPMSKALSDEIHNEIVSVYKNDIYRSNSEYQSKIDRGSKFHPFSVARVEDCPSVLVEIGFMTNDTECEVLCDASNRQKIAVAIANGIEKFFKNY
ncbi:MAG: N-acetylmuramoyl-L-alanine amidase [Acutalibacteraceae bacterium]